MSVNFYLENWGVRHFDEPVHMLSSDFSVISRILCFKDSGFFIKESIQLGEIHQASFPMLIRKIIKVQNSPDIKMCNGIPRNRLTFQLNALIELITMAQKRDLYIYFG